ncbi:DNA repair protein XRCC2 [Procambarus clarkii]|uniref:DNA repair protein XRCC2 n=1 Tax=Procambarus clarkii TaxID=6728 RepID=UPI001E673E73|nr:DNA repair protein XRCC2-like [Procambarus clarkii]XP_045623449.1 DNA repair protein XRCC2-like [Procambarus clarkii]
MMSYSAPRKSNIASSPSSIGSRSGITPTVASESGVALLARLGTRPSLHDLEPCLFPGGLQPGDIIEITGNRNCGKSLLSLHLVVSVLLPRIWRGINVGGCGGGVVFVDSDLHFSILHLENMMQRRIKKILKMTKDAIKRKKSGYSFDERLIDDEDKIQELLHSGKSSFKTEIDNLIKNCLKSLFYLKCTESSQFAITLLSIDELLSNKSNIAFIVIDSISAYYWYDRAYRVESWYKLEQYYNQIFKVFLGHIKKHKLVLLSTRQSLFQTRPAHEDNQNKRHTEEEESEEGKTEYEYMGREWASLVTCRVNVSTDNSGDTSVPLDENCKGDVIMNKISSYSTDTVTVGMNKCENAATSDNCRQIYSAEVSKNGKNNKLFFTVHEDGLRWTPLP